MRVTMKEIAERAGVHQATVDKVVHNRVGVSDEVRAKVQAIIDELGYKPNPTGRVLQRQGKKYRIYRDSHLACCINLFAFSESLHAKPDSNHCHRTGSQSEKSDQYIDISFI